MENSKLLFVAMFAMIVVFARTANVSIENVSRSAFFVFPDESALAVVLSFILDRCECSFVLQIYRGLYVEIPLERVPLFRLIGRATFLLKHI